MVFNEIKIKNIKEVTEPLKEEILKGDVHTKDETKAGCRLLDIAMQVTGSHK